MNGGRWQQEHGKCTMAYLTHLTYHWKKSNPIFFGRQSWAYVKWTLGESRKTIWQWLLIVTLLSGRLVLYSSSTTFLVAFAKPLNLSLCVSKNGLKEFILVSITWRQVIKYILLFIIIHRVGLANSRMMKEREETQKSQNTGLTLIHQLFRFFKKSFFHLLQCMLRVRGKWNANSHNLSSVDLVKTSGFMSKSKT